MASCKFILSVYLRKLLKIKKKYSVNKKCLLGPSVSLLTFYLSLPLEPLFVPYFGATGLSFFECTALFSHTHDQSPTVQLPHQSCNSGGGFAFLFCGILVGWLFFTE